MSKTPKTPAELVTPAPAELLDAPPPLQVMFMTIAQLRSIVHTGNPKRHDVPGIARSIARFGFTFPPMIDARSGVLAAGHGRIDGAALLQSEGPPPRYEGQWPPTGIKVFAGSWWLPVLSHEFASDEERDAYVVADNHLTEAGGWDKEDLRALVSRLGSTRLDGIFTREEYDRVVGKFKEATVEEIDVSTLRASFLLVVRGPVSAQPEVLRELKERLQGLPGVTVEGRIDGV